MTVINSACSLIGSDIGIWKMTVINSDIEHALFWIQIIAHALLEELSVSMKLSCVITVIY